MKPYILITFLIFFGACKKPNQDISFFLPITSQAAIPPGAGINLPFNVNTPAIASNSSSAFAGNNTTANLVQNISLSTLSMEVLSPAGEDFSFLNEITVYISAEGLPESEIATIKEIDPSATVINLTTNAKDLKAYLIKDEYDMRIETVTDEVLAQEHQIEIKSRFLVEARLGN